MRFSYLAKQGPQTTREGIIEADNQEQALSRVFELGLTPIEIKQVTADGVPSRSSSQFQHFISSRRKVSRMQVVLFTRQISDLLSAGIPLLQALQIVRRQISPSRFQECIDQIAAIVRDGGAFSAAVGSFPDIFPGLYVSMVRSGEMAGNLEQVLDRLAGFLERSQETRAKVQSSLLYPVLLVITGSVTVFVLLTWVIPNITVIFDDMNQDLPWPTLALVSVSGFFARFWPGLLAVFGVGVFYLQRFLATDQGRMIFDTRLLQVPLIGTFVLQTQIGQFARTLGTLLESGVDIISALQAVAFIADNRLIRDGVCLMSERVAKGASLAEAAQAVEIFPELVVSMISVGEQTGKAHQGLYKLADHYERQTALVMKRVTSSIEPVLILGLGLVVGFIVIAMLLPIFQLNMIIQ